jgi:hypothetical protein
LQEQNLHKLKHAPLDRLPQIGASVTLSSQ